MGIVSSITTPIVGRIATSMTAAPSGKGSPIARYASSDGTLPTLVVDLFRGFYFWDGEERSIADLNEVSGKGYYLEAMGWFNPAEFTLAVEYETPPTSLTDLERVMSLTIPGDPTTKCSLFLTAAAQSHFECEPTAGDYSRVYQETTGLPPRFGRCRTLVRAQENEAYRVIENGNIDVPTRIVNDYLATAFSRITFGYLHFYTYEDYPLQTGSSVCVVGWNYAMSDDVMDGTALKSPDKVPAIHIIGDSVANEKLYSDGGGLTSCVKKLAKDDKYAAWSYSIVGSTSLEDFYTRYSANTKHHSDSLIIVEGGFDWIGIDTLGAVQDIIGDLASPNWFIVEPIYGSAYASGSANRIGAESAFEAIAAWAGESHVIRTLVALQAANNGSADDLADVADDIVPRSLRDDTIHLNPAGTQVLAQQVYNAIKSARWL